MASAFNVMLILMIMMMTNVSIASVYSRDGSSSYLNKVQPTPYALLLFSKLFFPMVFALVGTVFTVAILMEFALLSRSDYFFLGVIVYTAYVAHLFSAAESDIMNPQYEQYATFSEQSNNPNETASALLSVLSSAILFIVLLFLTSNFEADAWSKVALVTTGIAVFKVITYLAKIKAFYKEKQ